MIKRLPFYVLILIIGLSFLTISSVDAAGIPKKAISFVGRFIESDLPSTTVFTDQSNVYNAGARQTFQSDTTNAGLSLAGVTADPSGVTPGDIWRNTSEHALKYQSTTGTKIIVTTDVVPSNYITLWQSTGTTAVANQGLNLPVALTELDSGVKGTERIIESADIGNQVQCHFNVRELTTATLTVTVEIVDASNTSNVLCSTTIVNPAANTNAIVKTTYAAKPSWVTGDVTLAVYTSGGNAAADFIFNEVSISSHP